EESAWLSNREITLQVQTLQVNDLQNVPPQLRLWVRLGLFFHMVSSVEQPKRLIERKPAGSAIKAYTGEVVYIYAFDVAYEMSREPVRELLGQPVAQFVVDASKRSPKHLFFYRPQMVRLPALERIGPAGPMRIERVVKLLPVGAISITMRVPFDVGSIEDLICFHDLQFS